MSKTVPEIEKWQSGSTELSSLSKILDNADTNLIRASYGPYQKRSYLKKSVFVKQWNFDALWRWGPKAQFSFLKKNLYGWNEQQKTRKPIFLTRKPTFFSQTNVVLLSMTQTDTARFWQLLAETVLTGWYVDKAEAVRGFEAGL